MNANINLASNKSEYLEKEQRILKGLRIVAVSMLITIAFVSIIAFIIGFAIPLADIKKQEDEVLVSLSTLNKKLVTYSFTKDRLNNIRNVLATRKDFTKPIDIILSNVPSESSVDSLSIDKDSVGIMVSSDSLIPLNQFINNMISIGNEKKVIKNVKFNSLSLNAQNGKYTVSMTLGIL